MIRYGRGWEVRVPADAWASLLRHFDGRKVPCGTSRTEPPRGSLGEWLMQNLSRTAMASYVGAILVAEGFAAKEGPYITFMSGLEER